MARKREPAESHDPSSKKHKTEDVIVPNGEWRNQYDNGEGEQTSGSDDIQQTNGSGETQQTNGSGENQQTNGSGETQQTNGSGETQQTTQQTNVSAETQQTNGSDETQHTNGSGGSSVTSRGVLDDGDVDIQPTTEATASQRPPEKEKKSVNRCPDIIKSLIPNDAFISGAGDLTPSGVKAFFGFDPSIGVSTPCGVTTPVGVNHYVPATPEVVLQDSAHQTLGLKTPTEWLASWNAGADAGGDAGGDALGTPPGPRRHTAAAPRVMARFTGRGAEGAREGAGALGVRKMLTWDTSGDTGHVGETGDVGQMGDTTGLSEMRDTGDAGDTGDACMVRKTLTWNTSDDTVEMGEMGDTRDMANACKVRKTVTWDTSDDTLDMEDVGDLEDATDTRTIGDSADGGQMEAMEDVASGASDTNMETAPSVSASDARFDPSNPQPVALWKDAWRESAETIRRFSSDEDTVASTFSDTHDQAPCRPTSSTFTGVHHVHELKEHVRCCRLQKPSRCDPCGLSFWSRSRLTRHIKKAHPPKPYKCGLCGRPFATPNLLNLHYARH